MFAIARSLFWLTLAYMVIKPGVDLPDAAALSAQAMAATGRIAAEQVQAIECDSLQCAGGKALAAAALQSPPQFGASLPAQPSRPQAPFPRPRPDRAG